MNLPFEIIDKISRSDLSNCTTNLAWSKIIPDFYKNVVHVNLGIIIIHETSDNNEFCSGDIQIPKFNGFRGSNNVMEINCKRADEDWLNGSGRDIVYARRLYESFKNFRKKYSSLLLVINTNDANNNDNEEEQEQDNDKKINQEDYGYFLSNISSNTKDNNNFQTVITYLISFLLLYPTTPFSIILNSKSKYLNNLYFNKLRCLNNTINNNNNNNLERLNELHIFGPTIMSTNIELLFQNTYLNEIAKIYCLKVNYFNQNNDASCCYAAQIGTQLTAPNLKEIGKLELHIQSLSCSIVELALFFKRCPLLRKINELLIIDDNDMNFKTTNTIKQTTITIKLPKLEEIGLNINYFAKCNSNTNAKTLFYIDGSLVEQNLTFISSIRVLNILKDSSDEICINNCYFPKIISLTVSKNYDYSNIVLGDNICFRNVTYLKLISLDDLDMLNNDKFIDLHVIHFQYNTYYDLSKLLTRVNNTRYFFLNKIHTFIIEPKLMYHEDASAKIDSKYICNCSELIANLNVRVENFNIIVGSDLSFIKEVILFNNNGKPVPSFQVNIIVSSDSSDIITFFKQEIKSIYRYNVINRFALGAMGNIDKNIHKNYRDNTISNPNLGSDPKKDTNLDENHEDNIEYAISDYDIFWPINPSSFRKNRLFNGNSVQTSRRLSVSDSWCNSISNKKQRI
ncbi:uncharacterized protein SCDLUD_001742 [Saccharomycodes ludwigii]|uniref:uncharacterized protein n=1 Tax=Saccharomycodes ludwigii TaxID=36035 RepID=UPI001E84FEF9|nr:hypothetical protein SCDLUD_001742 [Saccharomycodes ludwigii]KAH3901956.1 hypothetical protein SCDLUD_001742 [Saccharomycodes ludwigii]